MEVASAKLILDKSICKTNLPAVTEIGNISVERNFRVLIKRLMGSLESGDKVSYTNKSEGILIRMFPVTGIGFSFNKVRDSVVDWKLTAD